jgi:hypothetical protein
LDLLRFASIPCWSCCEFQPGCQIVGLNGANRKQLDENPNSAFEPKGGLLSSRNFVTGQEPGFQIESAEAFAWQIASKHASI